MEIEVSTIAGDDGLHALTILCIGDGNAGDRQWVAGLCVNDGPGDAVRARRYLRPLGVLGLRMRAIERDAGGRE